MCTRSAKHSLLPALKNSSANRRKIPLCGKFRISRAALSRAFFAGKIRRLKPAALI
jgi:hypothetical protein